MEGNYFRKADHLAEALRAERTILILDGLEPLQYPPNSAGLPEGGLKDRALQTILNHLAAQQPGLCIITSREQLSDLNGFNEATVIQRPLDHLPYQTAMGEQPCAQLLRALGVAGDDAEMLAAAREFKKHAFSLTLLGSYVKRVLKGDIRRRKEIPNLFDDDRYGLKANAMIAAYEKWLGAGVEVAILRLLGLFDRPAEAKSVEALREAPVIAGLTDALQGLTDVQWQQALSRLRELNLLSEANPHDPDSLDAHPLLREHFRQQLERHQPDAWREANLRIYEHLCATTKEFPGTQEEMTKLYTAVAHCCATGNPQPAFDEVYMRRIRRGNEHFSVNKLGMWEADLNALSRFFIIRWQVPSTTLTEEDQAYVLNETGFALQALGRLRDALQPMQAALDALTAQSNLKQAARVAGNLCELNLTLGFLSKALAFAEQEIELADRSGEGFERMSAATSKASVLHIAGAFSEAAAEFRVAEALQQEWHPQIKQLYSVFCFRYCDLLLSQREFQEVQTRAAGALELDKQYGDLLSIALDQLALGCVHLGLAQPVDAPRLGTLMTVQLDHLASANSPIMTSELDTSDSHLAQAANWLHRAVDGLRQAGQLDDLPRGLLARAVWARVARQFDRAARDLTEVFTVAERSEMRLHLCDYYLEAARLHLAQGHTNEARNHWATARAMVAEMGYHRRDAEVEELESQLTASA